MLLLTCTCNDILSCEMTWNGICHVAVSRVEFGLAHTHTQKIQVFSDSCILTIPHPHDVIAYMHIQQIAVLWNANVLGIFTLNIN